MNKNNYYYKRNITYTYYLISYTCFLFLYCFFFYRTKRFKILMNFLFSCLVNEQSQELRDTKSSTKYSVLVMEIANNNVYAESLSCET